MKSCKIKSILLILIVCVFSATLYAGITKDNAQNLVLNQILAEDIGNVDVYALNSLKSSNSFIAILDRELTCPYTQSWVFFIDDHVFANWAHPCRYIFVNEENGEYTIINETLPPLDMSGFDKISEIDFIGENKLETNPDAVIINGKEPSDHNFAVIISGGYNPANNHIRYWNDMSAIYCTLTQVYGYKPENIFVHSSDGTVGNNHGSLDLDKKEPLENDIRYPAFEASITSTFQQLAGKMGPDDQLFVYVTDHGDTQNRIILWGSETITPAELDAMLDPIKTSEKIVVMEQCFSGGFITNTVNITDPHRVVHTAANATESSWAEVWITATKYDEFVFYWTAAARGYYPGKNAWDIGMEVGSFPFTQLGIPAFADHPADYNPDLNGDGFVQMEEAFSYADNWDTWSGTIASDNYFKPYYTNYSEHPVQYHNIGFEEDLLSLNGLCGTISESKTVNGNYLVQPDLTINNGSTFTLSESTEPYELSYLTLGEYSNLSVTGNSFLNMSDKTKLHLEGDSTLKLSDRSHLTLSENSVIELDNNSIIALQEYSSVRFLNSFSLNTDPTFSILDDSEIDFMDGLSIGSGTTLTLSGDGSLNTYGAEFNENTLIQGDGDTRMCLYGSIGDLSPVGLYAYGFTIKDLWFESSGFAPLYIYGTSEFINTKVSLRDRSAFLLVGNSDTELTFSNNSELLIDGSSLIGMDNRIINIIDGSEFSVGNYSDVSSISFNIEEWGVFNYSNNCFFYESEINVSNSGQLNFPASGAYAPSTVINARLGGQIVLSENATLNLNSVNLNMEAGSSIKIKEGSGLNGSYVFPSQTRLSTSGNCIIGGNFTFSDISRMSVGGSNINDYNPKVRLTSTVNMSAGSTLWLDYGSELIIEEGAVLSLTGPMKVVGCRGSKITVNGTLETDETGGSIEWTTNIYEPEPDKEDGPWVGIIAEVGSTLIIRGSNFTGATKAISGTPASLTLENCTFTECENGIDLINCNNYTIENNDFTGVGIGSGIALTQSEGVLSGNSVSGFSHGIDITLCSPMLTKNTIFGNTNYGVCILGYNANPQFINPGVSQNYLNNEIYDNGTAQVYLKYSASAYMTNGKNNIYSGVSGVIPEVPCIMGVSNTAPTTKVALPSRVDIDAEYNYWGYSDIETHEDSFFDLWTMSTYNGYRIAYQPYSTVPYRSDNQLPNTSLSAQSGPDTGSILLSNAIKQELNGKYTSSINLYEKVIDKYDSTAEAFVAMARLPYVYAKEELDSDPLIKLYDEALQSEDELNRKFYKEMKVSTLLKAKKYNDAKNISIEMRDEAESEGEILLAEIDIAIAEMMMNAENRGKSNSNVNTMSISDLINRLTGNEDKAEPSYAQNNVLPESSTLYQNYPNPFNPVTQIKFALAKTADVKLSVYNISGQFVSQLASGTLNAGVHAVDFDGSWLNSGIYYYTLEVDGKAMTKKMVLTK